MSKKLSQEEVSLLNSYQAKNNEIIFSLGNIELNKMIQNEQKDINISRCISKRK